MGEFLEHRVPNDRYSYIGFTRDAYAQYAEKIKRILNSKIRTNETKMFKVIKSYFKKCSNIANVLKQGQADIVQYLQNLGGSPLLTPSWGEGNFDLKKWFRKEPELTTLTLLCHSLKRLTVGSEEVLGLATNADCGDFTYVESDMEYVLDHLNLDRNSKEKAVKDFVEFFHFREKLFLDSETENYTSYKVRDLQDKFPQFDWLDMINSQLLTHSRVKEDDEISVENVQLLESLLTGSEKLNKSLIANVLTLEFLYQNKLTFITHPYTDRDKAKYGLERNYQRFELCSYKLDGDIAPALNALLADILFDQSIQKGATDLVKEAIQGYKDGIKTEIDNEELLANILEKLDSIKLSVMFPDDVLNITRISGVYEEFEFQENKTLLEMSVDIWKFGLKIRLESKDHWIHYLDSILQNELISYDTERDHFNVPVSYTLYPWFHPNRSKFFNMVTLYQDVVDTFNFKLKDYAEENFNITVELNVDVAFKNYKHWIENGGKEFILSGFRLTSLQMFWLCKVHVTTYKYHRSLNSTDSMINHLNNKFLHLTYKMTTEFRDAFHCEDPTESELEMNEEFEAEYWRLSSL